MKRLMVVIPAAALLGTAFYWSALSSREVSPPILFTIRKGDFTTTIMEPGELRAFQSVTISAQKDLPVVYLVPEGTFVKKGEVLVRFDASKYEVALEESNAALQLAQLDLDELKRKPLPEEVERARLELERAKFAFRNAENKRNLLPELVEKGFVTKDTLEEADVKYLGAKADLQVAQVNFERVAVGATPYELEKAKILVERARNVVGIAKVKLKRRELRAPRDGLVVFAKAGGKSSSEKIQLGMIPFEGQPLLYLPDISTMVVDAEVNEIDIGKVKVGGPVEVRLAAYPGTVFHGKVLQIASLARVKQNSTGTASGIKVFDLTVQVEEKDPRLKPGLTATLEFIIDRQEDVISVPLSAVLPRRGEHVVFVSNTGNIQERKVVLGPSNENSVIIKQGLRPGEQVILNPPLSGRL